MLWFSGDPSCFLINISWILSLRDWPIRGQYHYYWPDQSEIGNNYYIILNLISGLTLEWLCANTNMIILTSVLRHVWQRTHPMKHSVPDSQQMKTSLSSQHFLNKVWQGSMYYLQHSQHNTHLLQLQVSSSGLWRVKHLVEGSCWRHDGNLIFSADNDAERSLNETNFCPSIPRTLSPEILVHCRHLLLCFSLFPTITWLYSHIRYILLIIWSISI